MNPSLNRPSKLPKPSAEQPPEPQIQEAVPSSDTTAEIAAADTEASMPPQSPDGELSTTPEQARQHPIPPPSEPMQYRAIGLVRGQYMPSAEQFTRGTLVAADDTLIDAVLLGRVMSLVKNHLSLDQPHLWVVYPRTRQEDGKLHVQIVGVWEPERLQQPSAASEESSSLPEVKSEEPTVNDGYFSIRGEAIYQSRDEDSLIIKIRQAARKGEDKPKFFKLKITGAIAEKAVGHFWDLHILREGNSLVIKQANDICLLPSSKKKPFKGGGRRPGGRDKPFSSRPTKPGDKPTPVKPIIQRREPLPKPIKRSAPESKT